MSSSTAPLKPFYMWAGGKSKLLKHYDPIWPSGSFDSYVEPFFGGGAVFGWLQSRGQLKRAIINDINPELTGVLRAVQGDLTAFLCRVDESLSGYFELATKEERKSFYYELRRSYWANPTADRLFLLMRLGFNGIWQTCADSKGLFGTPAGLLGQSRLEQIYDREHLARWSDALQDVSIRSQSYLELDFDPQGSLIYLDPPYRDSFTSYGTVFGDREQEELIEWSLEQQSRGATVLLANRVVEGDNFFEQRLGEGAVFSYFDVTYTAGRRKRTERGFEAKPAREFLALLPAL